MTKRLGPYSNTRRITAADYSSTAGRVLLKTTADLVAQLGGDPSPAEALLIQSAAVKSTRLYLLTERILNPEAADLTSDEHCLAWMNSLRHDLLALGLERRVKDVTPSLAEILKEHAKSGDAPTKKQPARADDATNAINTAKPLEFDE